MIGIDSGFVLASLTGGMILRLNPNKLSDRESILYHFKRCKRENVLVAIAGSELSEVHSFLKTNDRAKNHLKLSFMQFYTDCR